MSFTIPTAGVADARYRSAAEIRAYGGRWADLSAQCIIVVEPTPPSPEAAGKRGVSFNVMAEGPECSTIEIGSSAELPLLGLRRRGEPRLLDCNP